MTEQEKKQMFDGRWRMKVENSNEPCGWVKGVKDLCYDFFCAGIELSQENEGTTVPDAYDTQQDFDYWWNLYDKKCGREKCLKKWQRLTSAERKACLQATPAYVKSTPDKQFRKHPLSYLNGKAWNDEIIYENSNKEQQRINKLAEILVG